MTERRFECTLCGRCCRRPGVVVIEPDELVRIAHSLQIGADAVVQRYGLSATERGFWLELDGVACPFLLDDRCSIHEIKPRQCRTYPFWPEIVGDDAAWQAEAEHCPGIGRGPSWADAEVQAMLELLGE